MTSARPAGRPSRRQLLRWGGGLAAVGALGAVSTADGAVPTVVPVTVDQWRTTWDRPVYVAHRGSGDTYPEHTMVAYQAAFDWGAPALEISVGITADDVLICMHDATYDRTTDGTGRLDRQSSSVLESIRVVQPQLGEYWVRHPPRVPRLDEVLDRFGGRVVLCLEAKDAAAYQPMMAQVTARGLRDSVIVKVHHASPALPEAAAAGYPRFAYLGSPDEVTKGNIAAMRKALDPRRDVLVIPAGSGDPDRPYLPDDRVRAAVDTGVPVWVFPVHRRSEAQHFFDRGVRGAVCAGYGWVTGVVDPVRHDGWAGQRVAPGELTSSVTTAPTWTSSGELALTVGGRPQFVMPGQCCPLPTGRVEVDVRWTAGPRSEIAVTVGHDDDRYYETGSGVGTGYDILLRPDGRMTLQLHRDGRRTAEVLGRVETAPVPTGAWVPLSVDITPDAVTVERGDTGDRLSTDDTTARGGYLHLGRVSDEGGIGFRGLTVG